MNASKVRRPYKLLQKIFLFHITKDKQGCRLWSLIQKNPSIRIDSKQSQTLAKIAQCMS